MTTDPDKPKRGPEPDRLKLEGPWEDRVADSFKAPPPPKVAKKTAKKAAAKKTPKAK